MKKINIYTDGSCRPSTKQGSYGVLIVDTETSSKTQLSGTQKDTTNNIMEMTAFLTALNYIYENQLDKENEVTIYSDSQYVLNGATIWWKGWKANNFRTTTGVVKNLELWKQIHEVKDKINVKLLWVKGHSTNANHNEIDKIVYDLSKPKNE